MLFFVVIFVVVATLDPGNCEELCKRREKGKETSLKARGIALPPMFLIALQTILEGQVCSHLSVSIIEHPTVEPHLVSASVLGALHTLLHLIPTATQQGRGCCPYCMVLK